jgi:hypothetical protein
MIPASLDCGQIEIRVGEKVTSPGLGGRAGGEEDALAVFRGQTREGELTLERSGWDGRDLSPGIDLGARLHGLAKRPVRSVLRELKRENSGGKLSEAAVGGAHKSLDLQLKGKKILVHGGVISS